MSSIWHQEKQRSRRGGLRRGFRARLGFTLVELLVTMFLLAIALSLLLVPVVNSLGYFRGATARADAQTAARIALDAMARELAEAMYVQLDMYYDSPMVAFVPPLRVDPDDPNSDIVTPPRPDWTRSIRFWRALRDPTLEYNPGTEVGPANPYFVARTVVPDPFKTNDPWNRFNDNWAARQNADAEQRVTNWAPIPRVVSNDWDVYGARRATLQPGYPYLAVRRALTRKEITEAEARRRYRNRVVALTPNARDYDVPLLQFQPTVVSGEWLRPVADTDSSVYRAQYPLWRLGAHYTGWAALLEDESVHELLQPWSEWARDPFVLIYRYSYDAATQVESQNLIGVGCFDVRSRTMKIYDPRVSRPGRRLYDTGSYPYEASQGPDAVAFGIDWIDGSLRFDFPGSPGPLVVQPDQLGSPIPLVGQEVYDVALPPWAAYAAGTDLFTFVLKDSVSVRIDTDGDSMPDRALTRVDKTPREDSDEFQLGIEPDPATGVAAPKYGWIRLPATLGDGQTALRTYWMEFRWRNNGVWTKAGGEARERPDLVSAYYRTVAVMDIGITVTRADPSARAGQRLSQSVHMTRRVKLHNSLREIRYGEE